MTQVIEDPTRRDALLDVIPANKERPVGDLKIRRSLGCSDHEMVEFGSPRGRSRARNKITALDFQKAGFGPFRGLLGRITKYPLGLERRAAQESWLIFKLLQALIWSMSTIRQPAWR